MRAAMHTQRVRDSLRIHRLHLTETELREAFRREFRALIANYGKSAKLPEFAVKAGVVL